MTIYAAAASLFLIAAVILLLDLTPEQITKDVLRFVSPEPTLRERAMIARKKKKSRKLTEELDAIHEALAATGKEKQFALVCSLSLTLLIAGGFLGILLGNPFLAPILGAALALLPFVYAKNTISYYTRHMRAEMETALSIITTSYIRSEDIVSAVAENIPYIRPPIRELFKAFLGNATAINSDVKASLRILRGKIDNDVFREWADALLQCQDDRTLKDTLLPIVNKLTDVKIVNNELKALTNEPKKEYAVMALLLVGNIPLLYMLNRDWFHTLMFSLPGKLTLAVCGAALLVTAMFLIRYTRPIEFKR